jgi:hypothetical protein
MRTAITTGRGLVTRRPTVELSGAAGAAQAGGSAATPRIGPASYLAATAASAAAKGYAAVLEQVRHMLGDVCRLVTWSLFQIQSRLAQQIYGRDAK